mmetsp:Transcript_26196/g.67726  ORF Transcript_26196/g.67726 Transcript_26196/m.67726 type:complete len:325 (+) Transcript_26196:212-1186(+)
MHFVHVGGAPTEGAARPVPCHRRLGARVAAARDVFLEPGGHLLLVLQHRHLVRGVPPLVLGKHRLAAERLHQALHARQVPKARGDMDGRVPVAVAGHRQRARRRRGLGGAAEEEGEERHVAVGGGDVVEVLLQRGGGLGRHPRLPQQPLHDVQVPTGGRHHRRRHAVPHVGRRVEVRRRGVHRREELRLRQPAVLRRHVDREGAVHAGAGERAGAVGEQQVEGLDEAVPHRHRRGRYAVPAARRVQEPLQSAPEGGIGGRGGETGRPPLQQGAEPGEGVVAEVQVLLDGYLDGRVPCRVDARRVQPRVQQPCHQLGAANHDGVV